MHEMTLVRSLMESLLEGIKKDGPSGEKVSRVSVRVGSLELHSSAAFRQHFEALSRGTPLEGAQLDLVIAPAVLKCPCGRETPLGEGEADGHDPLPVAECPSCGKISRLAGGRGVDGIEVSFGDGKGGKGI